MTGRFVGQKCLFFFSLATLAAPLSCKEELWTRPSQRLPAMKYESYFPPGVLAENGNVWQDEFRRNWYSKHLKAMEEPPLLALAQRGVGAFRFIYLPSFRHPIVVRIQKSKEELFLVIKKLNGRGGSNPGVLMVDEQRVLPDGEWEKLYDRLENLGFWILHKGSTVEGDDGTRWILEWAGGSEYNLVDIWSPKDNEFRRICIRFLELAEQNSLARDLSEGSPFFITWGSEPPNDPQCGCHKDPNWIDFLH